MTSHPCADELEISLFGCGIGESLAIHAGDGIWVLVDSCQANAGEEPMALQYLRSIDVDIAKSVKLIVFTHWHADHIAGAAELVSHCVGAKVAFSSAMAEQQFLKFIFAFGPEDAVFDRETSGAREFAHVLDLLLARHTSDVPSAPIKVAADLLLLRNGRCHITAVSPSPKSVLNADAEAAAFLVRARSDNRFVLVPSETNHNSIALWVSWDDRKVLLGADLEQTTDPHTGWRATLSCQIFPDGKAGIFKIPHHGSPNGDSPDVWTHLIDDEPLAIVTTYGRGVTPRPAPTDIERLLSRTPRLFCTTVPKMAVKRRSRTVDKTMAEVAKVRRPVARASGQIQVRWPASGSCATKLLGSAQDLSLR